MPPRKKRPGRPNAVEVLASKVDDQFDPIELPTAFPSAKTAAAQERLDAALSSVNNVLLTMSISRAVDRSVKKKDLRGRLSESNTDILRAAIVFAGAGVDAALKKLMKDTIREVVLRHESAKTKCLDFIDRHLAAPDSAVDRRRLGLILTDSRGSQAVLLESYERELTGDSLQSADQVNSVCGASGVDERMIRERLKEGSVLDQMFRARNEIVHQLDLTDDGRMPPSITDVRTFAAEALAVAQEIINAVGRALAKGSV